MPDIDPRQTELPNEPGGEEEPGALHIEEKPEAEESAPVTAIPSPDVKLANVQPLRAMERPGTVEHLAARRPASALDASTSEMKRFLSELRSEIMRLVTGFRWEGKSAQETADQLIPLLNVGSIQQWKPVLLPFLLEIDRAGNMVPVWLEIIGRGDPPDLPRNANPAETMEGRARRIAILMLGYYKSAIPATEENKKVGSTTRSGISILTSTEAKEENLTTVLGKLLLDPNTSMYASQSLVKHGTTAAMQTLISALKDAEGWAKVDIVEGCIALNQGDFYDILVASGLDHVRGLESYIAIPLYRALPLENYLNDKSNRRFVQQAALIFNQVLQDSMNPSKGEGTTLPPVFDRKLPAVVQALFEGARREPMWQNIIALHRLGLLLGRYWANLSRGEIRDPAIIEPVYNCLPMMNEVERWMAGPGRDVLLSTLSGDDEEALTPVVKTLGELREPRAIAPLIQRIENTQAITDHPHALALGAICDTLGRLGDRRAMLPMLQLLQRTVDTGRRGTLPRQANNLPEGDADIPSSIVYGAVIRACGLLGDRYALDAVLRAASDLDPYVRSQALDALKQLDPAGEDSRSRQAARAALDDPREQIVRTACQLVLQYRDPEATSALQHLIETRPELAAMAYDTLRQVS